MNDLDFVRINAKDLARVLPFRGDRDVRYYLNGVYAEPSPTGGVILVATNGHILAAMFSADSYAAEAMIIDAPKELATAVKSVTRTEGSVRIASKDSPLEVPNGIGVPTYVKPGKPTIDGKYPEWRAVIPADDKLAPGLPHAYNAIYLQIAIEAICGSPKANRYGTLLQFHHVKADKTDGTAAIVRSESNFIAVVMPVHADKVLAIPAWASKPIQSAKAA